MQRRLWIRRCGCVSQAEFLTIPEKAKSKIERLKEEFTAYNFIIAAEPPEEAGEGTGNGQEIPYGEVESNEKLFPHLPPDFADIPLKTGMGALPAALPARG